MSYHLIVPDFLIICFKYSLLYYCINQKNNYLSPISSKRDAVGGVYTLLIYLCKSSFTNENSIILCFLLMSHYKQH